VRARWRVRGWGDTNLGGARFCVCIQGPLPQRPQAQAPHPCWVWVFSQSAQRIKGLRCKQEKHLDERGLQTPASCAPHPTPPPNLPHPTTPHPPNPPPPTPQPPTPYPQQPAQPPTPTTPHLGSRFPLPPAGRWLGLGGFRRGGAGSRALSMVPARSCRGPGPRGPLPHRL
jgi:hypothetical protein